MGRSLASESPHWGVGIVVSIQLISPASGEYNPYKYSSFMAEIVSIQLISPASGEVYGDPSPLNKSQDVSIQLISPASGEKPEAYEAALAVIRTLVVSIQLISPASGEESEQLSQELDKQIKGFHSINFPSEWGAIQCLSQLLPSVPFVSIQLISPASGELQKQLRWMKTPYTFPFN